MAKKDKTELRRIEGGPSREELFDCLRFGWDISYFEEYLWGRLHRQMLKNVPLIDIGRVYATGNDIFRIKYKLPGRQYAVEAFYSTNTRSGYICRAEEITSVLFPGCVVPAYRPLTDYQIMCLLQLASISRHPQLIKHIKARIIRGIKGIQHPFDSSPGIIVELIEEANKLFDEVWKKTINNEVVAKFRKILK